MLLPWDLLLVQCWQEFLWYNLERTLMPELEKFMKPWERYLDDIITYIKPDFITKVIDILNTFHQNIKSTYEVEHTRKISFLDVL